MKRYKKILVPVDGSELSKLAFEQGLSLAQMVEGEVTIMHVIEPHSYEMAPFDVTDVHTAFNTIETESKAHAESMLDDLVKSGETAGVTVRKIIVKGNVANEIIQQSSNFDIVIMGTLGQSALSTLIMGSVAEKVSRHACCPVMLVREIGRECTVA
jgi:nucleotide-binding universal stress UspA family protein